MDFDPLSFFEPEEGKPETGGNDQLILKTEKLLLKCSSITTQQEFEIETGAECVLQPLDLPLPAQNPPYHIMHVLLKLLMPEEVTNFSQVSNTQDLPDSITDQDLDDLCQYLGHNRETVLTIRQMPYQHLQNLTSYLTRLISYPFPTYTEDEVEEIYNLASKVMTSYSAPALKGDTTRKMEIGDYIIKLYEPGLTGDKIGNITWGAAGELSKKIINDYESDGLDWLVKDQGDIIVELGAGTGLITILLAKLGFKIISTDLPDIVNNLKKNIALNDLKYGLSVSKNYAGGELNEISSEMESNVLITPLDWTNPKPFIENKNVLKYSTNGKFTRLLFADPVYAPEHPEWVQKAVATILASQEANPKVIFMLGMRDRFEDVREDLWAKMRQLGLKESIDEVIDGVDDYGKLSYQFKVFTYI